MSTNAARIPPEGGLALPLDDERWAHDGRLPQPVGYLEEAFRRLIIAGHGGIDDGTLTDTPSRAAAAWRELMRGYGPAPDLRTFDAEGFDEIIAVGGLAFYSTCEHHLLPFAGTADFAYLPGPCILGLSKFARLLDHHSRRLQVQERLTQQLADALDDALDPRGVMVVLRAEHFCMACRGVEAAGHVTTTSVVRGRFKENPTTKAEAMELLAR
jgi:GTP cyclohydrolase I